MWQRAKLGYASCYWMGVGPLMLNGFVCYEWELGWVSILFQFIDNVHTEPRSYKLDYESLFLVPRFPCSPHCLYSFCWAELYAQSNVLIFPSLNPSWAQIGLVSRALVLISFPPFLWVGPSFFLPSCFYFLLYFVVFPCACLIIGPGPMLCVD